MTFILIALAAQVLIGFIIASEIGSEREIGKKWSLALCLFTPFLFGLILTLISPKIVVGGSYKTTSKNGIQKAVESSLIVIALLLCVFGFNYNSGLGIMLGVNFIVLVSYVIRDKYMSFYDLLMSILIICFVICCVFALAHFIFGY